MAEKTFFGRLKTLFSSGTIVRRTDDGLKVADLSKVQSNTKLETNFQRSIKAAITAIISKRISTQ